MFPSTIFSSRSLRELLRAMPATFFWLVGIIAAMELGLRPALRLRPDMYSHFNIQGMFLSAREPIYLPDPQIGWRHPGGYRSWCAMGNFESYNEIRLSSDGWNSREFEPRGEEPEHRILLLGDSHTEQLAVAPEEGWVRILESLLDRRTPRRVLTYNLGLEVAGPMEQEHILRRHVDEIDPDVVVLVLAPHTDVVDCAVHPTTIRRYKGTYIWHQTQEDWERGKQVVERHLASEGSPSRRLLRFFEIHSLLIRLVRNRISGKGVSSGRFWWHAELPRRHPDPETRMVDTLHRIHAFCRERGSHFMIACYHRDPNEEIDALIRRLEEEGLPLLDPGPWRDLIPIQGGTMSDMMHFNITGNRMYAELQDRLFHEELLRPRKTFER